jgi:hypothetical protein
VSFYSVNLQSVILFTVVLQSVILAIVAALAAAGVDLKPSLEKFFPSKLFEMKLGFIEIGRKGATLKGNNGSSQGILKGEVSLYH